MPVPVVLLFFALGVLLALVLAKHHRGAIVAAALSGAVIALVITGQIPGSATPAPAPAPAAVEVPR